VRELEPGQYGNIGRLVPSLSSDELVAAADCREDSPCAVCGDVADMTEALCDSCAARFVHRPRPGEGFLLERIGLPFGINAGPEQCVFTRWRPRR
jgi:hypothetical protein